MYFGIERVSVLISAGALQADFINLLVIGNSLKDLHNAVHFEGSHSFLNRQIPQLLDAGAFLDIIFDFFCARKQFMKRDKSLVSCAAALFSSVLFH
jgi:hypothetical protein